MKGKTNQKIHQGIEELEQKIQSHRKKIIIISSIVIIVSLLVAAGLYLYFQLKSYDGYQVLYSQKREDSSGTQFAQFQGNILKYSNDGAFYIDSDNRLKWNQTYEMQKPVLDICEGYAVISERGGKNIYIMNTEGPCGQITANMPIQQVHVANQGTVAVLMEEKGVGYIHLYDREGNFLAEGELHAKNSGYPLDISLSNDGKKMAVSMLDINEGNVKTTIAFYNFGSVGQNEIDNITGTYAYTDMVIPNIKFLTNDIVAAFGDKKLILYEGSQKPEVIKEIEIKKEIRSIFYNGHYAGLVFEKDNDKQEYAMEIYDLKGTVVCEADFAMAYEEITFLENDEICILNNQECAIYNLRGNQRFHYNFQNKIWKVLSTKIGREYIFLMEGATEKIRIQ